MGIAGGVIAVLIVAALVLVSGRALLGKWRRDEGLFDGSPEVVVRNDGGPARAAMLVRLARDHGYSLADRPVCTDRDGQEADDDPDGDDPGADLVFVRDPTE